MTNAEQYRAMAWFVAGYMNAVDVYETDRGAIDEDEPPTSMMSPKAVLDDAVEAVQQHANGVCLACGREGVVILDGFFCERCSPGIAETEVFDDE